MVCHLAQNASLTAEIEVGMQKTFPDNHAFIT